MRVMRLSRQRPVEEKPLILTDVAVPEPGRGEIRIRVGACGVCHTDLHIVEGDLAARWLPLTPGHQIVGTVDEVGAGVEAHRAGERVGVPWLASACGKCSSCAAGKENLCDSISFTGYDVDGGFAEYALTREESAYPLPEGMPDEQAAPLLCAGVIGLRALRRSGIQRGGRIGLYGFGASAHLCIQIAAHWECESYVFTRDSGHKKHARELGAAWTGQPKDAPPRELDAAVLFAPAGWIVHEALRHLKKGGTLAIAGIHMSPIPEMPYELLNGERAITSVANSTRRDVTDLLRLAAEIPLRTAVTVFPLEQANEALLALKKSRIRGAAVLSMERSVP